MNPWEKYQQADTAAKPWEKYAAQAENEPPVEWKKSDVGDFARNSVPSFLGQIGNFVDAAAHPIRTAQGTLDVANGALQKILPESVNDLMHKIAPDTQNNPAILDALKEDFKNRLGTEKGFHDTLTQDPAALLTDASLLLGGIGGITTKIPQVSKIATKAAMYTNPVSSTAMGAAKALKEGSKAFDNHFGVGKAADILGTELRGYPVPTQAPSLIPENADLSIGPPVPKFGNVPGSNPTAATITGDPGILLLEMNARNRNPVKFFPRDMENISAAHNVMTSNALNDADAWALQEKLNLKTTPLRDEAIQTIKENAQKGRGGYDFSQKPDYIKPLDSLASAIRNSPDYGEKILGDLVGSEHAHLIL